MQKALAVQKVRIAELEERMRLEVSGHRGKHSVQAKRFEAALALLKKELAAAKKQAAADRQQMERATARASVRLPPTRPRPICLKFSTRRTSAIEITEGRGL